MPNIQASPPAGEGDAAQLGVGLSYCPEALAARCCSSIDLNAGDSMAGDMAGVKGRKGYCAFFPGT